MRKFYFILLGLIGIPTLILSYTQFGLAFAMITFGLGYLLHIALVHLLLVMLAVLPVALLWRWSVVRASPILVWLIGLAVVLVVPSLLSPLGLARDLAAQKDIAATRLPFDAPIGVEIQRRVSPDADLWVRGGKSGRLFTSTPCSGTCERLLLGGDVAWVRIVLRGDGYGNDREQTHALLVPGSPAQCQALNPDMPPDTPCALYAPDHGKPADLTMVFIEYNSRYTPFRFAPYSPFGKRHVTAHAGPDDTAPVVFRASQLFHFAPRPYLSVDLGNLGGGSSGDGITLARRRSASAPIDLPALLQDAGLRIAPDRPLPPKAPGTERNQFISPPPDAHDAARIASLLNAGPQTRDTYSNAFNSEINTWLRRLRWSSGLSETEHGLLCRIISDPRIRSVFWEDQVMSKHGVSCPKRVPDTPPSTTSLPPPLR